MTNILKELKSKSLQDRRKENKLILFYKAQKGTARVELDELQRPLRRTKHMRPEHYRQLQTRRRL